MFLKGIYCIPKAPTILANWPDALYLQAKVLPKVFLCMTGSHNVMHWVMQNRDKLPAAPPLQLPLCALLWQRGYCQLSQLPPQDCQASSVVLPTGRLFGCTSQKRPNKKWSGRTNLRPKFGRFWTKRAGEKGRTLKKCFPPHILPNSREVQEKNADKNSVS